MHHAEHMKSTNELPLIIFATIKSWNIDNARIFAKKWKKSYRVRIVDRPEDLSYKNLKLLKPTWIFFPHWSWVVSSEIHENFACILFHITDLPFGRGGSPLQNLISRGIYRTKISAVEMSDKVDAGRIYFKESLDISRGSAGEIFERVSKIIFSSMIPQIIKSSLEPEEQSGEVTYFNRLNSDSGNFNLLQPRDVDKAYDLIRMLDGEGYPRAFVKVGGLKIEFHSVKRDENKILKGEFIIYEDEDIGSSGSS